MMSAGWPWQWTRRTWALWTMALAGAITVVAGVLLVAGRWWRDQSHRSYQTTILVTAVVALLVLLVAAQAITRPWGQASRVLVRNWFPLTWLLIAAGLVLYLAGYPRAGVDGGPCSAGGSAGWTQTSAAEWALYDRPNHPADMPKVGASDASAVSLALAPDQPTTLHLGRSRV